MVFTRQLQTPSNWVSFFCWFPVQEIIMREDRSALVITYWLTFIERRLITNSMTGLVRWDYRKSPTSDAGINVG